MGNKLSCRLKPNASPKLGQHSGRGHREDESHVYGGGSRISVAEPPAMAALELCDLDFLFCDGHPILRLSDVEMPDEWYLQLIPSDHPRASTIFLKKYQMDVQGKMRNICLQHVFPDHHREIYSSCSTIFLDNSTICQPDMRISVQCLVLAIYYHIKKRDGNRTKDIFDERLHPLTQEAVPEEYFHHNPDLESIYKFIWPFFSALKLTAEFLITTLIFLERLTVYAEIDICPMNWRRIVLGAILLAAKYLRDRAAWNLHFCQIHQGITLKDINELETQYLFLLRFRLNVSASVYAKYYFDLRSLASDHKLPNAFAPLQKERAQTLEGIENRKNEIEDSPEPLIDPVYGHGRYLDVMSRKLHQPELAAEEQRPLWMDREDRRQRDTQGGNSLHRKTEEKQLLLEKKMDYHLQENGFKKEEMGKNTSDDRGQDKTHCERKNMKS